jgi:hypothetical protein
MNCGLMELVDTILIKIESMAPDDVRAALRIQGREEGR